MIAALTVMPLLVLAIAAMALAMRRVPCDACGRCTHCTGMSVSEMIRARQVGEGSA